MLALLEATYVINVTSNALNNAKTEREKEEIGHDWTVFSRDKG